MIAPALILLRDYFSTGLFFLMLTSIVWLPPLRTSTVVLCEIANYKHGALLTVLSSPCDDYNRAANSKTRYYCPLYPFYRPPT